MAERELRSKTLLRPADFFQQNAADYDTPFHGAFYRRVAAKLIGMIPSRISPSSILEIGAGTGFATRLLEERFPKARVMALEPSPEMLARGRRRAAGADWLCQPLNGMPPGNFDLVFSSMSFHWLDEHEREKMIRLAGGGVLAMALPAAGGPRLKGNTAMLELARRLHEPGKDRKGTLPRRIRHPRNMVSVLEKHFRRTSRESLSLPERYYTIEELARSLHTRGALYALFEDKAELAGRLLAARQDGNIEFNWQIALFVAEGGRTGSAQPCDRGSWRQGRLTAE
ncbi:MAG: methyltransferase domain-containing protein [Thermoleophilia bacterium]|nr:methyltransferase domain-containing protein [Thermoleophilia bacterium]